MPSKKKNQKSASRLSQSEVTSTTTPSVSSDGEEFSEEEIRRFRLEEASRKFPSLISKTAFIGRISEDAVETVDTKGCKIWLSESSMLSSSISPGSIVSVKFVFFFHLYCSNSKILPFSRLKYAYEFLSVCVCVSCVCMCVCMRVFVLCVYARLCVVCVCVRAFVCFVI